LPKEYHDFLDVFEKRPLEKPPTRGRHNITIELKEGAVLPRIQGLRRISEEEAKIVEKYIKDNLVKGWIVPSSFKYASPILFVRKANRALRLCMDYRGLNKVTKKDSYPLPLIDETIARVIKARYYTKFNIEAAFNNLYIATDRDADLTTFTTRYGNYKSLVLPFGLSIGPAYF